MEFLKNNLYKNLYNNSLPIIKILLVLASLLSFFMPINSFLYKLTISGIIGGGYYVLSVTQPQLMLILSLIVKYNCEKISHKINKILKKFTFTLFNSKQEYRLQLEDDYSSLVYMDHTNQKQFIFLFNEKMRSNDLIIFKDENQQDITELIEPYLGPMQNFHGVKLTPSDFNFKKITVFRDGDINMLKIFEENEPIIFV